MQAAFQREGTYLDTPVYAATLPNLQPAAAGYYRAYGCRAGRTDDCVLGAPVRLDVQLDQPRIVEQPVATWVARVGDQIRFRTKVATGLPTTVRWQKRNLVLSTFGLESWTDVAPGAYTVTPELGGEGLVAKTVGVASELLVPATLADNAMQYRAVVTAAYWQLVTEPGFLNVVEELAAPQIVGQPATQNVVVGSTAVFVATVSGTPPFSYQWRRNGVAIPGANTATLSIANVTAADAGSYTLAVSNRAGTTTSDPATLGVTLGAPADLPPQITAPPASLGVTEGNSASFAVSVSGTGPYTYQWYRNGHQITGNATAASYTIDAAVPASEGAYTVRVTNGVASVLSAPATLTVAPRPPAPVTVAPTIVTPPVGLAVLPGGGATFAAAVSGTAPLRFQWKRNGVSIADATGPVLHLPSVSPNDAGQYTLEVMNAAGTAASPAAELIVIGAPTITLQPADASVAAGASATFRVAATGPALRYQWSRNGVAVAGATAASYTTPPVALADSGATYAVVVYNGAGIAFSANAVLTVAQPAAFPAGSVPLNGVDATAGQELWITDGTAAGTVLVKDIWSGPGNAQPRDFTRVGDLVLFVADDGLGGAELWRTDGTEAGTVRVTDLRPGAEGSLPWGLIACGARLFFGANDGSSPGVYTSDGTAAGTVRLANAILGTYDPVGCLDGVAYFHGATGASGGELWRSDGTAAGTALLADIVPGSASSNPEGFIPFQGQLYFQAANQLWRTDGTTAGTVLVSAAPSSPRNFAVNGGLLYFSGTTAEAGAEPWRSDGTAAGTVLVADLVPGSASSYPYRFTVSNGVTFFAANPGPTTPATLWRTDGTAAGTTTLANLRFVAAYGDSMLDVNGTLYFSAAGAGSDVELYKSDGTAAGTVRVTDLFAGSSGSYPTSFFRLGNLLHFNATTPEVGSELFRSDGTAAGTVLVKDLCLPDCSGNPRRR